jgi:hypothetical protein
VSEENRTPQGPADFRKERSIAIAVLVLGWFPLVFMLIMAPGFVTATLNNLVIQKIMIGATLLQIVCCFWLSRTKSKLGQLALVAIGTGPLLLSWMLGPAIVTILGSLNVVPK